MNALLITPTFVVIILFVTNHIQLVIAKDCASNEQYVQCEIPISCQPSCDKPNETLCPSFACMEGCHCKDEFVRVSDTDLTCIRKDQCDDDIINGNESTCGLNEIQADCAPLRSCQASCENSKGKKCPRLCSIESCICQKGYVRDNNNDLQCIEQTQCPTTVTISSCVENEVAVQCALLQTCQPSCIEPNRKSCQTLRCSNGCICNKDYLRATNDRNSPCIKCTNNSLG